MPKIRTHKGTAKRVRATATGRLVRRHAMRSHLLEHKSARQKRLNGQLHPVSTGDTKRILRIAPYIQRGN
jgi:large subunit ribosomal protein L35